MLRHCLVKVSRMVFTPCMWCDMSAHVELCGVTCQPMWSCVV